MTMKYHGWIELANKTALHSLERREISYTEYIESVKSIREKIISLINNTFNIPEHDFCILESIEDLITIHLSGQRNHWRDGVLDLLEWIKINAPGSHGQIHINNDEHGTDDEIYKVYTIANNQINEYAETRLKPFYE